MKKSDIGILILTAVIVYTGSSIQMETATHKEISGEVHQVCAVTSNNANPALGAYGRFLFPIWVTASVW